MTTKLFASSGTVSANRLKWADTSVAPGKRSADQRYRIRTRAEDHQLRRRHTDLEKQVGAAESLAAGHRLARREPRARTRDRSRLNSRITQASEHFIFIIAHEETSGHTGQTGHENGRLGTFENREPRARERVIAQALDQDVNRARTADPQPPYGIVGQVVADDDGLTGGHDARGRVGHGGFEAAARKQAFVGAILAHHDPGAFTAIRAPLHPYDRGECRPLPGCAHAVNDGEDTLGLAPVHGDTMAQTGLCHNSGGVATTARKLDGKNWSIAPGTSRLKQSDALPLISRQSPARSAQYLLAHFAPSNNRDKTLVGSPQNGL